MPENEYSSFQKDFYTRETPAMKVENHRRHNENPNYWDIMLGDLKDRERWRGKRALDFGCGCGRNVLNMHLLAEWDFVDGADISGPNCRESEELVKREAPGCESHFYETNGYQLDGVPSDTYDFVMSTIVLQHICVHDIRFSLMQEIFRAMRSGGIFSFQMGYGGKDGSGFPWAQYDENVYSARSTNAGYDVSITDPTPLVQDLQKIGFVDVEFKLTAPHDDSHKEWIWVKARKP